MISALNIQKLWPWQSHYFCTPTQIWRPFIWELQSACPLFAP